MTTFANPFNNLPNMQTQEDVMEVNTDLKNAMAMEEDNLDIDLELGDGVQQDADGDSMMDDDSADGHQQGDADQQMDDDFQDPKDQDDEVLDYVEEAAPVLEIPMTEDAPLQAPNLSIPSQSPSIFQTAPAEPVSSLPPDVPAQETTPADTQASAIAATTAPGTSDAGKEDIPKEIPDTYETVETIRSLFETDEQQTSLQQDSNVPSEEPITKEDKLPDGQERSGLPETNTNLAEALVSEAGSTGHFGESSNGEGPKDVKDQQTEHILETGSASEPINVASEVPHATVGSTEAVSGLGATHKDEVTADTKSGSEDANGGTEEPAAEPIGVIVTCQGQQMSLFPPYREHGTPETYLLPDDKLASGSIRLLLKACSSILSDSMSEHEELELQLPSLNLVFKEHASEAEHYSIRDMSDLHFQLHQNDGVEQPESLHVVLETRLRLSGHIDHLYTLAAEGKGIRHLRGARLNGSANDIVQTSKEKEEQEEKKEQEDDDGGGDGDGDGDGDEEEEEEDEEANADEARTTESAEDLYEPSGEQDQEEDEFGEPDLPHSELEFDNYEEAQNEENGEGGEDATQGTKEGQGANRDQHGTGVEKFDDEEEEEEGEQADGRVTDPAEQLEDAAENDAANQLDLHEAGAEFDEQTAFDEAVVDDPYAGKVDPAEATNYDSLEADDAQHRAFEPAVEVSQSLHSATQPEEVGLQQPRSSNNSIESVMKHAASDATTDATMNKRSISGTLSTSQGDEPADQANTQHAEPEADDIFSGDYDGIDDFGDEDDLEDDNLDIGFDNHPPTTPQSLKRSRAAADEVGDDLDDGDGHQLKRTRSG